VAHRIKGQGKLGHISNSTLSGLMPGSNYAALGIRLKPGGLDASIVMDRVSLIIKTSNRPARWGLILNPEIAGPFTWVDSSSNVVQVASGINSLTTVTGGTFVDGGYFNSLPTADANPPSALRVNYTIDNNVDELILMVRPITFTLNAEAAFTYRTT
jgi:hypothetical protein